MWDFPGNESINQHCVYSLDKGLNLTDSHLYVECQYCRFKIRIKLGLTMENLIWKQRRMHSKKLDEDSS